jgi:hypothetical protein
MRQVEERLFMNVALWVCSFLGLWCDQAPSDHLPGLATIQSAYEREASAGNELHDKGLKVLNAKCHNGAERQSLCEVTFISADDPTERLYFDIVAVAQTSDGWILKSGLCKR